ncbi:MAG: hypothetical protein AAFN93_26005, partial [Bacteroidota bacterium]
MSLDPVVLIYLKKPVVDWSNDVPQTLLGSLEYHNLKKSQSPDWSENSKDYYLKILNSIEKYINTTSFLRFMSLDPV